MTFLDDGETVPIPVRRNRWIAALVVIIVLAVGLWWLMRSAGPAPPTTVELSPRATFLRTAAGNAEEPAIVSLEEAGVRSGQRIRLVREGRWAEGTGQSYGHLLGVFSASDSLAPADRRYRVPGAVGIEGVRRATNRNPIGGWETDVPQDFGFGGPGQDSVQVRVPEGARYLFLGVDDVRVGDNVPADSALAVRIVPLAREDG